jgi:hypothetical protein
MQLLGIRTAPVATPTTPSVSPDEAIWGGCRARGTC